LEVAFSTRYSSSEPVITSIEMAPITDEEQNAILQEVEDALERTTIDKGNLNVFFKTSNIGKVIAWMP